MIERGRSSETESGTRGDGKRDLGFWRHSSLCINITGSHHVSSSLPLLLSFVPGNINFIIFFPCPLHAFYHPSRARTKRRDSSLSYVTTRNEVQRAFAASMCHDSYACSRCSVFFARVRVKRNFLPTVVPFVYYNRNYVVDEAVT